MKYTFRLNDRDVRYDQVMLYHGHEIGLYGYFSGGKWTVMAHIDGDTVGYYPNAPRARQAAEAKIDNEVIGI